MSRRLLVGVGGVLLVLLAALVIDQTFGTDDTDADSADTGASASVTARPTVSDEEWCAHWQAVVQVQAQYAASQSAADGATLLTLLDELRRLGYPESLDSSGYTELNAVLDDLQSTVDPSFTPSALPSEPADVQPEGGEEAGEHHGVSADDAPFGAFLAAHCAA